jgi:riboflavin synthase
VAIRTRLPDADLFLGASVAVDGACLTVVEKSKESEGMRFLADASVETLKRTTLGERKPGDRVNLERPMALGERLGGHLVLGHVDGVGRMVSRERQGAGTRVVLRIPKDLLPLVVEKGSIALDGISLTVNEFVGDDAIALFLIPETLRETTWGEKPVGAFVNVEADILGKHVARLLAARLGGWAGLGPETGAGEGKGVDVELLSRAGFL